MHTALRRTIAAVSLSALTFGMVIAPAIPRATAHPVTAAMVPATDPSAAKAPAPEAMRLLDALRPVSRPALDKLALQFEANVGQVPADIRYFTRLGHDRMVITEEGAVYHLRTVDTRPSRTSSRQASVGQPSRTEKVIAKMKALARPAKTATVRMEMLGGLPSSPVAERLLPGVVHYYLGKDPTQWHTNVPTFAGVRQRNVYPGIDVVYYGTQGRVEYDFVVAPGADPSKIRLAFRGADKAQITANGDLQLTAAGRTIRHQRPDVYQEVAGVRRAVAGRYVLSTKGEVSFQVGSYDRQLALVIDPQVLDLGNGISGIAEAASGDNSGNTYMTGTTPSPAAVSTSTPLCAAANVAATATDAFVAKLAPPDAQGNVATLWVAILGGRDTGTPGAGDCSASLGTAVALDPTSANVFVGGVTNSPNFVITPVTGPTATPAFQSSLGDDSCFIFNAEQSTFYQAAGDGFVVKLTAAGAFSYATYLGGNLFDLILSITVDAGGFAYVAGSSQSQAIPALQQPAACTGSNVPVFPAVYGTIVDTSAAGGGVSDVLLAKLNSTGSVVSFVTLQGGSGIDEGVGVIVTPLNEIIVTSNAYSGEVVTAMGPLGRELAAAEPQVPLRWSGVAEGFSQCLGLNVDFAGASVQPFAKRVKKGFTAACSDVANGVISKFTNPAATAPPGKVPPTLNGTYYVGGTDADTAAGIAIDKSNNIYIAGQTLSGNFPSKNPVATDDPNNPGTLITDPSAQVIEVNQTDEASPLAFAAAYVVKLTLPTGTTAATDTNVSFSSPLGGSTGDTTPTGIAVTPSGTVFVSGTTTASDSNVVPASTEGTTTAYVMSIPPSVVPNTAPTVIAADQILLGPVNTEIDPPPALHISTDIDGNVTVAGVPSADGVSLGVQIKATIPTSIDVKPGAKKNQINLNTRQVQVALLSTPTFDAPARIDPLSITFGKVGDEPSLIKLNVKNKNVPACKEFGRKRYESDLKRQAKDPRVVLRLPYLVCHFTVATAHFEVGDTVATLKAKTKSGADVVGTDVVIVKKPGKSDKPKDHDDDDNDWSDDD
jgi:hypothetical protein